MKTNIFVPLMFILILVGCNSKNNSEPIIKEIEPFTYCAIEMQGSWSQYNNAIEQLNEEIKRQNIIVKSEVISVWHSYPDITKEEDYKWEVGYVVANNTDVKGALVLKKWNTKKLYSQVYDGPSDGSTKFFKDYWAWFKDKNLKVVRPLLEISYPEEEIGKNRSKFEALVKATN